MATCC